MKENVPLRDYTTMKLGGPARYFTTATTTNELLEALQFAESHHIPFLVLGQGSNMIVTDNGFPGVVILNRLRGFSIVSEDAAMIRLKMGAGERWDSMVQQSVDLQVSGIEALSAIPGYVGAAPVQNIGAYGQEIADTLLEVEAYDTTTHSYVTLQNSDCDFSYRQSIFNSSQKNRYIIISITLELTKGSMSPPFYDSLQAYLNTHEITDYSPDSIRNAIIAILTTKLTETSLIANSGSFFKNPIAEKWQIDAIRQQYPDVPVYDMGENTYKVPAGWLIEKLDISNLSQGGFCLYPKNNLVIINKDGTSYKDLVALRDTIIERVRDNFRIVLVQEPEELLT